MNIIHIVCDESLVINLILASKILSFSLSNRWTSFATCVFTCELARIGSSDTFDGSLSPFLHVHRSQWVEKVVRDTKRIDPQTQHNDRHNERWRLDQIKSIGSDFKNWSDRLRNFSAIQCISATKGPPPPRTLYMMDNTCGLSSLIVTLSDETLANQLSGHNAILYLRSSRCRLS